MQALAARAMSTATASATASAAARARRPLSPHLTIYKFRINMITSVIFRGTGIFLTGGLAAVSIATLPSSSPITDYVWHLQQYPLLSALTKFAIAGPLTYHLLGGLRHLAWDNIVGQNPTFVRNTGMGAMGAAGAVGLVAMFTEFKK